MSLCSDGLSSDPYFLVNFIMSHYLGPDVFSDIPRCSASQRLSKGLPPYTPKHIGSSSLTVAQLQNLYYYVLRNANSTLLLHPDMVLMYLKGYLPMEPSGELHQFTYYFPTNLHPQKRYSPSLEVVKGIVVIDDPALAFISNEELQRFRCLSRLDDLKIDRVVSLSPRPVQLMDESRGIEQDCFRNGDVTSNGLVSDQVVSLSVERQDTSKGKKEEEAVAGVAVCVISEKLAEAISGDIPQRKEKEQKCSRKEEAMSNGLANDQVVSLSGELEDTSKRKKEEEAVASDAVCVIIEETAEAISGDIPQRKGKEQECSRKEEAMSNGFVTNQNCNSSAEGVPGDIPQRKEKEQECSRKEEAMSNGLVTNQECNSSAERVPGDLPQRKEKEQECSSKEEAMSNGLVTNQDCNSSAEPRETCKRKRDEEEAVAAHASCGITSKTPERFRETYKRKRFRNSSTKAKKKNGHIIMERDKTDQPTSLPLVIISPEMKAEPAVVTTGTASIGAPGTSIGVVDIGVNKVAYFFQVALPGVSKDYGEFSCEIQSDGKVILEGSTTTGQKTIEKHSRVFKMNIRKLCPPGPFKLSFNLPGPVDPRLVSPNFRSDGIFEAVVIRQKNST